jgi:hypothetical protein
MQLIVDFDVDNRKTSTTRSSSADDADAADSQPLGVAAASSADEATTHR